PLAAEIPRSGKAIVSVHVQRVPLVVISGKGQAVAPINQFRARISVRDPSGKSVGAATLDSQFKSAAVTVEQVCKRRPTESDKGPGPTRLIQTEKQIAIFAIIDFCQNAHA